MIPRRQVLKGSAALAAASVTGLSGCLGFGGGGTNIGEWLIDPGILPNEPENYSVSAFDLSALADQSDVLPREEWREFRDNQLDRFDFTRLFAEDTSLILDVAGGWGFSSGYNIVETDIDTDTLDRDLIDENYQVAYEHQGYQLYEHEEQPSAVAVSGSTLVPVTDSNEGDPLFLAERVLDAQNGDDRRYTEVVPEFETLLDSASGGDLFSGNVYPDSEVEETDVESGQFRNQIGDARASDVGSENTDVEAHRLFLDERDVNERDLEDWSRESDAFDRWRDIEVDSNGAVGVVRGQVPTRDLFDA